MMGRAEIEIKRKWDGRLMQTMELSPEHSAAVLIGYTLDLLPEEGGLPAMVAGALARGLTECGVVAGRWFDEDVSGFADAELWPPPKRNPLQRLVERVQDSWSSAVVTTRSAEVVVELLDRGWELQYQALLVLDAAGADDPGEAVRELSVKRDWRGFAFREPVRALVAPGVDGDFILVAAATEEKLEGVLRPVVRSLREAGFSISASEATSS